MPHLALLTRNSFAITLLCIAALLFAACGGDGPKLRRRTGGNTGTSLVILTTSLPNGMENVAYQTALSASGGSGFVWTLDAGAFPTGVTLAASGLISGTPTLAGNYSIAVTVTNSASESVSASYSLTIDAAGALLQVTTSALPDGTIGAVYPTQTLAASGGTGSGYTWSITAGALPDGLTLNSNAGTISGTPTTAETQAFTVTVTDSATDTATQDLSITINATGTPFAITTTTLPDGFLTLYYGEIINTSGGSGSGYTWTVLTGSLPTGLSLSGVTPFASVFGTPTAAGTYQFTVQVDDDAGASAQQDYEIIIPPDQPWSDMATSPLSAVLGMTAVWTGTEMIVWGGANSSDTPTNAGARYNPTTNVWVSMSTTNAPTARSNHTAIWTGSVMVIWGGDDGSSSTVYDTGGIYNPTGNSWTATDTTDAPSERRQHTAVWTGSEMIVWGGYLPSAPYNLADGGVFDPVGNSWDTTKTELTGGTNAPAGRRRHTAVWTGTEMIVWGGDAGTYYPDGGAYTLSSDSWRIIASTDAPTGCEGHTAVWTGNVMVVWGGASVTAQFTGMNTGGIYDPVLDEWTATDTTDAPDQRHHHTALWDDTAARMVVWGGEASQTQPRKDTGGYFDPVTNTWEPTTPAGVDYGRSDHVAVLTDDGQMLVWGGEVSVSGGSTRLVTGIVLELP